MGSLSSSSFVIKRAKSMGSLYFSVVKLPKSSDETGYLWGLWDIYPGFDVSRPPILSGIARSKDEVINIAGQYGLDKNVDFSHKSYINRNLKEMSECRNRQVISFIKRAADRYYLAVWNSMWHYLIGEDPIFEADGIDGNELKAHLLKLSGCDDHTGWRSSGYLRNYIRKREAIRKFAASSNRSGDAVLIDFLYTNESYWGNSKTWLRHRIVKKTKDNIFIEKWPYHGNCYLKTGWQAMILYTIIIDRKEMDETGQFHHKSIHRTFYTRDAIPKRRHKRPIIEEESFDESIVEVPLNDVQWAMSILKIDSWPTTSDEIKKAFARAAMRHHPDKGGDAKVFIKCKAARELLLDRICRR
jgi:hypothetical protein